MKKRINLTFEVKKGDRFGMKVAWVYCNGCALGSVIARERTDDECIKRLLPQLQAHFDTYVKMGEKKMCDEKKPYTFHLMIDMTEVSESNHNASDTSEDTIRINVYCNGMLVMRDLVMLLSDSPDTDTILSEAVFLCLPHLIDQSAGKELNNDVFEIIKTSYDPSVKAPSHISYAIITNRRESE